MIDMAESVNDNCSWWDSGTVYFTRLKRAACEINIY